MNYKKEMYKIFARNGKNPMQFAKISTLLINLAVDDDKINPQEFETLLDLQHTLITTSIEHKENLKK